MNIILANIFSGLSLITLIISAGKLSEKEMLKFQIIDVGCTLISNLLLLAYGGVIAGLVGLIRNILMYKGVRTKKLVVGLITATVVIGTLNFMYSERVLYSLLPICASMIYTIPLCLGVSFYKLKIALFINATLWGIYSYFTGNYVGILGCLLTMLNIVISYSKLKKAENLETQIIE